MLVDVIINHVITMKISMSVGLAESIANQIEALFPTEVKDTYFMRGGSHKNPKGKLYAKFYNSMRLLKTSGLVVDNNKRGTTAAQTKTLRQFGKCEPDIQHVLDQIIYDTDITFPELQNLWRATTKFRINDIQKASSTDSIIKKWTNYKAPLGFKLIDIDFNTLYPDCNDFISVFGEKFQNCLKIFEDKIKDPLSHTLFDQLKNTPDICANGKNSIIFCLFHAVFVPTSKKVTRDENGKKSQIKYSIRDSVNSFIIFKNSISEVEDYILYRKNENQPIQPFIIVIGTPVKPKEIFIFFDCIKYKLFSITSAVDTCFKIFHLFN
ncbi:Uncharacterized protein FWK35_00020513 [Aphis craccivora]|uniref:Uncharacterized protein n=1 Tax=Aphis craccivora TaxID=307492 RepID=A0A6G0XZX1_APHCR|nr:Uncharacterized protein FWK35_00020513 [Aphis craccivora]